MPRPPLADISELRQRLTSLVIQLDRGIHSLRPRRSHQAERPGRVAHYHAVVGPLSHVSVVSALVPPDQLGGDGLQLYEAAPGDGYVEVQLPELLWAGWLPMAP